MVRKRKFARSIQQEGISRDQISGRLKEFGWIPSPTNIDLGEDFIVHIYIEGNPTGKTFHLQAKSLINIDERRRKNSLIYKFRTQDIFDWEQFEEPVVLLIWDIKQKLGKWTLLEDVVQNLDSNNPQWRNNKSTVSVVIPWSNATDDVGLLALRERIAVTMLPNLLNRRGFFVQIKEEESELVKELHAVSIKGGQFEASGTHFVFPQWFIRWFDPTNFTVTFQVTLPREPIYIKLVVIDLDGESFFREAELVMIHRDENRIEFTNDHTKPSVRIIFTLVRNTARKQFDYFINLFVNDLGKTIYENRDILRFLRAFITSTERKIILSNEKGESSILESADVTGNFPFELKGILPILEKMCRIQDNVAELLEYPPDGISAEGLRIIDSMHEIIDKGRINLNANRFEIGIQKEGLKVLLKDSGVGEEMNVKFEISFDSRFELVGKVLSLGKENRFVSGKLNQKRSQILEAIRTMEGQESYQISLDHPVIVDVYLDLFLREAKRMKDLLIRKDDSLPVFLFGDLLWKQDLNLLNAQIEFAIDTVADIGELALFCKSRSNYPIQLYKMNDLPKDIVDRILSSGRQA